MWSQQEAGCPILLFQYVLKHPGDKKEGECQPKALSSQLLHRQRDQIHKDEVFCAVAVAHAVARGQDSIPGYHSCRLAHSKTAFVLENLLLGW